MHKRKPPTLSELRKKSDAVIVEGEQIAIKLRASIARLYNTLERSKEICEPPLFIEPYQPPWTQHIERVRRKPASEPTAQSKATAASA